MGHSAPAPTTRHFSDHLGIASVNMGFGGEDGGGIYHSIYDDFYWHLHFADTDFVYGRALAQTAGTSVMRLASAELRRSISTTSPTPSAGTSTKSELARDKRSDRGAQSQIDEASVFAAVNDPRHPRNTRPAKSAALPQFRAAGERLRRLQRTPRAYDEALAHATENGGGAGTAPPARRQRPPDRGGAGPHLNDGLPNRDWFKHQIYAPGFYTGYGVKTLPPCAKASSRRIGSWPKSKS